MPLSFGTTPSQVSLFRHLADPKQVSQDTLRELKYKSAKKAKESQLSFGGRNGQSYASRATYINNNNNNNRREGSIMRRNQSYAGEREEDHDFEPREPKERFTEEKQEINGDEESYEEDAHANDVEEVNRNQESSFPKNSGLTYEMEKSQVQTMIDSEVDREKEHFLAELRKYRGQTTREFSMEDTLTDIQFEYDRLKGGENAANVVRIMGIVLQVVVYAVQWGNGKFGPLLKLDNGETSWAMQTGESISNHEYDNVLEKLYRKHWRKGSMSPEAELGMMLVGSAGVFHFQTHVNEKLSKHSGGQGKKSGGGGGGGGFNLMDLVGPVMGLMGGGGGGGIASSVQPPKQAPVEPPKRFDFVAGRPAQQPSQPPQQAPAAYVPHTQPFAPAAPVPPRPPQGPSLVEMEQQFAKRQQDMLNRMDEVTRRADEQMRASQARQLDLERQLQQTQMRLHQMQSSVQQQQHLQQQQHFQQQHQLHLQFQQQQQQTPVRPKPLERAKPMEPARNIPSVQQRKFATAVNTPLPPPSVDEDETQDIIDRRDNIRDDAPLSPLVELSDGENGDNGDNGENGENGENAEEVDTKFDVKEVMVTEKQRRRKAPVTLEIDELSLAL